MADHVTSTSGMLRFAASSGASEFIIGTEVGILHKLRKENPGKRFYAANDLAICPHMKMNSLVKVRDCLRDLSGEVVVTPAVRERALAAVERMVALG